MVCAVCRSEPPVARHLLNTPLSLVRSGVAGGVLKRECNLCRDEYLYRRAVLRAWLVALMALLNLPASGYCLLEKVNLVAPVDCCAKMASHEHDEKSPCGGYGCCPIEYSVYSSLDSGIAELTTPSRFS